MVVIKFNTGNAAFGDDAIQAIVDQLKLVINDIEAGYVEAPVRDVNGNKIGRFCLTLEDQSRDRVDYLP